MTASVSGLSIGADNIMRMAMLKDVSPDLIWMKKTTGSLCHLMPEHGLFLPIIQAEIQESHTDDPPIIWDISFYLRYRVELVNIIMGFGITL